MPPARQGLLLIFPAIEGTPPELFVWMPAHTSSHDVGVKRLSDGSTLSQLDRDANDCADGMAKAAAAVERVPRAIRDRIKEHHALVEATAK